VSFRTSNQTPFLPLLEYSVVCEKEGRQAQAVRMTMVMSFCMLFLDFEV
jgi:hypothetical protein